MTAAAFLSAFAANGSHMFPILTYGNPAFPSGLPGFVSGKFVGSPLLMSGFAPFTCNFTLFFAVH